jgi:hypothetical protein
VCLTPLLTPPRPTFSGHRRFQADTSYANPNSPGRPRPSADIIRPSLKTAGAAKPPGVRIPLPPPSNPLDVTI